MLLLSLVSVSHISFIPTYVLAVSDFVCVCVCFLWLKLKKSNSSSQNMPRSHLSFLKSPSVPRSTMKHLGILCLCFCCFTGEPPPSPSCLCLQCLSLFPPFITSNNPQFLLIFPFFFSLLSFRPLTSLTTAAGRTAFVSHLGLCVWCFTTPSLTKHTHTRAHTNPHTPSMCAITHLPRYLKCSVGVQILIHHICFYPKCMCTHTDL